MIPPLQSLVKYDTPVLVSTTTIKKKEKGPGATARGTKKGALPPVEQRPGVTQTEDILNSILPPREWTEDGQLWVQYVSSTPATRLDVINLQEKLDQQVREPPPPPPPPPPCLLPSPPPPRCRPHAPPAAKDFPSCTSQTCPCPRGSPGGGHAGGRLGRCLKLWGGWVSSDPCPAAPRSPRAPSRSPCAEESGVGPCPRPRPQRCLPFLRNGLRNLVGACARPPPLQERPIPDSRG